MTRVVSGCPTTGLPVTVDADQVRVLTGPDCRITYTFPCPHCTAGQHLKPTNLDIRVLLATAAVTVVNLADREWGDPTRDDGSPLGELDVLDWVDALHLDAGPYIAQLAAGPALDVTDTAAGGDTVVLEASPVEQSTVERVAYWRKVWPR